MVVTKTASSDGVTIKQNVLDYFHQIFQPLTYRAVC